MFRLEICLDSFESAQKVAHIVSQGENRIELCGNLVQGGGLTPSIGLLRHIKTIVPASRIMVMIRPRSGSFVYSETEVETMMQDIAAMRHEGARGVVFGCLTSEGGIDVENTKRLVDAAAPMDGELLSSDPVCDAIAPAKLKRSRAVTFHRAFDVTVVDADESLQTLRRINGVTRLLTSGHSFTAMDGSEELASLMLQGPTSDMFYEHLLPKSTKDQAAHDIIICPASGIKDENIAALKSRLCQMQEAHLSGGHLVPAPDNRSAKLGEGMGFGGAQWKLDQAKVERVWEIVKDW